ncbi:formate dehydrogenase subunit gamma [Jannaschia sp. S6380]|uniref:formate dehydrogenase subunit gamma n=1 Tax=Jannaschia sp. S6380 TaxID=2926408 RepID=UPI001FF192F5|nr:formate dehydrogenase subunit gamma [Jannaschia sp. S6380]MCK0168338.1 formate dehydrogenase subunit gamma [Jannaschia sp. S6380]
MFRAILVFLTLTLPALAQDAASPDGPLVIDRSTTGGATTLEEILARQEALRAGEEPPPVDDAYRRTNIGGPGRPTDAPLGGLGGASDADLWRGIRFDTAPTTTQQRGPAATTLIQTGGMDWLTFRAGPLRTWGGGLLLGTLFALALFYLLRGRIRIHGPRTGRKLLRFRTYERFAHWLLAGSFIALAITGLLVLFGRVAFIPIFGHAAWAPVALASKWVHNNVGWAFMVALVAIFVMWVIQNLPDRTDLKWLARGGGLFGGGHVPAKKFNAGQKLIFWSVILGGASLSASGLSLLFPFEMPMFAGTFEVLNGTGVSQALGLGTLETDLTPQEEMQYAQLWHGIVAFGLTAVILAHIYLGSLGMEGAYDAMGDGEVEEQWAREHHSIWAEAAIAERDGRPATDTVAPDATPAE